MTETPPTPPLPDPDKEMKVLFRPSARLRWEIEAAVLSTRADGGPASVNTFLIEAAEHYIGVLARRYNGAEPFDIGLGATSVGRRRGKG